MVGTIVLINCLIKWYTPQTRYDEDLTKNKYRICFNEVNIRTEPNTTSTIVDKMYLGQYVELSGNIYQTSADIYAVWYETSDGDWIVADAVLEKYAFEFKFGH